MALARALGLHVGDTGPQGRLLWAALCVPKDGEWPLLSLCSWAPCGSTVTERVEGLGWLRNPAFVWEAGGKGLKCLHLISLLRSLNLSQCVGGVIVI